ncbi:hypothetical protein L596_008262 [Steinernema carpocapsae]|uniref:Peptidase C1A papain C-terminal domain-containing protein n=1 Tax=Steinernema carpocapsae TaxID=34508 RepID=A0A4U5PBX6_STECR|nr:hypothetical protein L596_008262 [Steinernema carpocapsae]
MSSSPSKSSRRSRPSTTGGYSKLSEEPLAAEDNQPSSAVRSRHRSRHRYSDSVMKKKPESESQAELRPRRKHTPLCVLLIVICVVVIAIALTCVALAVLYHVNEQRKTFREVQSYLKKMVADVNNAENRQWKAEFNRFGMRKTHYDFAYNKKNASAIQDYVDQLKTYFDSPTMKRHLKELEEFPADSLPTHFDARAKWPHCPSIANVPNQGGCGSCYAVSAVGVASDRACIASNGTEQGVLSVEDVLGCCSVCGNCFGGDPLKAMVYWAREGLVTGGRDGCRPYGVTLECGTPCTPDAYSAGEQRRTCIKHCQKTYYRNVYEADKHYGAIAYTMYPRTMMMNEDGVREKIPSVVGHFNDSSPHPLSEAEIKNIIMKELFLFGPTTLAFPVTEEFLHYAEGIFSPFPQSEIYDRVVYWHVVKLIGWGHDDNGNQHWLAVNSFGDHWGDNGLFRIDTALLDDAGLEYETGLYRAE